MKRVFVSYYDHSRQHSEDTWSLEVIEFHPQKPFMMERTGWLVYENELVIQVALERIRQNLDEEWEYGINYTILKSTIIDLIELKKII